MRWSTRTGAGRLVRLAAAVVFVALGCSEDAPSDRGAAGSAVAIAGNGAGAGGKSGLGGMGGLGGMSGAGIGAGIGAGGTTAGGAVAAGGSSGSGTAGTAVSAGAGGGGMAGSALPAGSGGSAGMAGMAGTTPPPAPGDWGTADPAMKGTFATVTENNVGPGMAFTMFRPMDLAASGKKHPLITWGNGTGTVPSTYSFLLTHLASHGFVIIASNSMNVAQGTPPPMVQGVTWVGEQNADPMSPLYQHIDMDHVGATGHSQGAFATSSAAADPSVTVWAPIEGARRVAGQHGPGLLICGTMDTTVPCSGAMSAFNSSTVPVMYAELKAASHTNWFGGRGTVHPFVAVVTGWMRVHLMGDTALKPMFYGPSCTLCGDDAWVIQQKMLD